MCRCNVQRVQRHECHVAVHRVGDVSDRQPSDRPHQQPSVGRLFVGPLHGVRVPVRLDRVHNVRGVQIARVHNGRGAQSSRVHNDRPSERNEREDRRQTADPVDPRHEHGVTVRGVHRHVLVHERVPPSARRRTRRAQGHRAPAVRRPAVGSAPAGPRGSVLLGAVRPAGRRPVAGRATAHRPGALDTRRRVRLGPLRAAHRQHSVRRDRVRVVPVLLRAQRTDAIRPRRPAERLVRLRRSSLARKNVGRPAPEFHVHLR